MYKEPIFLSPQFQERIWGGQKLNQEFGYDIPYKRTGECWGISAHPHGTSEILNGPLQGKTLAEVWEHDRELFGNVEGNDFPLLVKILDANADLSVQVHPDDTYARTVENEPYGKTECWYVIDCEADAEIVYGHHAESKEEFEQKAEDGEWEQLLKKVKVKPGDFFYVPSGTIHAIGKGIMILETQQSSDITYRVYDYGRRDAKGNTRELHLEKAIDVAATPHEDPKIEPKETTKDGLTVKKFVGEKYFSVYHWNLAGSVNNKLESPFLLVSVLNGDGEFIVEDHRFSFEKGDHFLIPSTVEDYQLSGDAAFVVSHP